MDDSSIRRGCTISFFYIIAGIIAFLTTWAIYYLADTGMDAAIFIFLALETLFVIFLCRFFKIRGFVSSKDINKREPGVDGANHPTE